MSVKDYYQMAIKVADQMLNDPQNNVNEVLKKHLGYERGLKGFFTDPWNLLFFGNPLLLGGRVLYRYMRIKQRQRMELEMMKRNIIAKQQAIIKRMEEESRLNEAQRQNLQETIDFLEETLKRIEDSRNQTSN
jgi:hypothetical protein